MFMDIYRTYLLRWQVAREIWGKMCPTSIVMQWAMGMYKYAVVDNHANEYMYHITE